jgi:hypothetical protein
MTRFSPLAAGITIFSLLGVGALAYSVIDSRPEPCAPVAQAGKASTLVSAASAEEGMPTSLTFPTPLITKGTEISVLEAGEGYRAGEGAAVDFQVAAYLGSSGQLLTASSYFADQPVRRLVSTDVPDYFSQVLACAAAGDRIIITDTVETVFGPIPEDELVQNDSTAVLVVDVQNVYPPRADGSRQPLVDNAPMIVQTPSGRHGVTVPMGVAPDDLVVYTVKRGSGVALSEGDQVVVHFTGVVWETKQTFASSFDQGLPVTLSLVDGSAEGASGGIPTGVFTGLIGQTVGSQVAIVVPPSLGYPDGQQPAGVADGSTLIYVFDILGVQ